MWRAVPVEGRTAGGWCDAGDHHAGGMMAAPVVVKDRRGGWKRASRALFLSNSYDAGDDLTQ